MPSQQQASGDSDLTGYMVVMLLLNGSRLDEWQGLKDYAREIGIARPGKTQFLEPQSDGSRICYVDMQTRKEADHLYNYLLDYGWKGKAVRLCILDKADCHLDKPPPVRGPEDCKVKLPRSRTHVLHRTNLPLGIFSMRAESTYIPSGASYGHFYNSTPTYSSRGVPGDAHTFQGFSSSRPGPFSRAQLQFSLAPGYVPVSSALPVPSTSRTPQYMHQPYPQSRIVPGDNTGVQVSPKLSQAGPTQENTTVVVSNLPDSLQADGLEELLQRFGSIKSLLQQRKDGQRSFKVKYRSSQEAANAVCNLDGRTTRGKRLVVRLDVNQAHNSTSGSSGSGRVSTSSAHQNRQHPLVVNGASHSVRRRVVNDSDAEASSSDDEDTGSLRTTHGHSRRVRANVTSRSKDREGSRTVASSVRSYRL